VIAELRGAIEVVPGCCLLDVHSDADHNRSVFTFAGTPGVVEAAALSLAGVAVARIDLRQHHGTHPRMGAIDVVPFIPLSGIDLAGCCLLAERVGARLAADLAVPAYLYGEAARPGRPRVLTDLRRGGFEALTAAPWLLQSPDFGPDAAHPTAGAVAVGARGPLVAFNLLLDTADVDIARRVAAAVRESSGGLAAVQALGMFLPSRGRAQVSTNLLDHARTSIGTLVAAVRAAAAAELTRVVEAELVGLAPAAALTGLDPAGLAGMPGPDRSIEARLEVCAR
jgi:glutamate formiminotransferase